MSLDFSIAKPNKVFTFTAECKSMEQTIARVNHALGASSSKTKAHFIAAKAGKVAIIGYSQDTFCAVLVPNATSESDGIFGVEVAAFAGVIKGRSMMEFTRTKGELTFKLTKGKYNGKLTIIPVQEDQAALINERFSAAQKGENRSLSPELLATIREGMTMTAIKDVLTGNELASHVSFTAKECVVSMHDPHHFALYRCKIGTDKFKDFRIVLPINHFNIIDRMLESDESKSKFVMRPESIRVENKSFLLVLPATQTEDINYTKVATFIENEGEMDYQFEYDTERMMTMVDNLYTLKTVSANFEISYSGKGLDFAFITQAGSAKDSLKVKAIRAAKKPMNVRVDPTLLRDLLGLVKSQKTVLLSVNKRMLRLSVKSKSGGSVVLATAMVA